MGLVSPYSERTNQTEENVLNKDLMKMPILMTYFFFIHCDLWNFKGISLSLSAHRNSWKGVISTSSQQQFRIVLFSENKTDSDWLISPVLYFVVTENDQQPILFNTSCPRLAFGGLCLLSLGLLEILLPCLGLDPQSNLLLPPVPLLTNRSGPLK